MKWSPLGENAVLVWCADEAAAATLARGARVQNWPWLVDVVQAYASVALYFQRAATKSPALRGERGQGDGPHAIVVDFLKALPAFSAKDATRRHIIPVCYEKHLDLDRIAGHTGLDREAIVRTHSSSIYTVYAIGFCPGFPYLGYLPGQLANVPRLPSPRLRVAAGSVGLTGRQTGIYTEARPGGWNIVGQTPLELVDVADDYFPLRTGDEVTFERIDEREFGKRSGERLTIRSPDSAPRSSLDTIVRPPGE